MLKHSKDSLALFCPRCGDVTRLKWYADAPLASFTCLSCREENVLPDPSPSWSPLRLDAVPSNRAAQPA